MKPSSIERKMIVYLKPRLSPGLGSEYDSSGSVARRARAVNQLLKGCLSKETRREPTFQSCLRYMEERGQSPPRFHARASTNLPRGLGINRAVGKVWIGYKRPASRQRLVQVSARVLVNEADREESSPGLYHARDD